MNAKSGGFKFVKPTRRLSEKVGSQGGVELTDAIARADKHLASVATEFPKICGGWIEALTAAIAGGDDPLTPQVRQSVLSIANDIRGQGGTFGFPLITLVADSLVKFVDPRENSAAVDANIIQLHIKALERLVAENITGDGGKTGVELRTLIQALTKRRQKP